MRRTLLLVAVLAASASGGTQNITDEEARVIEDVLSRHRDGLARLARREAPSDNT